MKKNFYLKLMATLAVILLTAILIVLIGIYRKDNCCGDSNNSKVVNAVPQATNSGLDSLSVYDSNGNLQKTIVWVIGDSGRSNLVIWNKCPDDKVVEETTTKESFKKGNPDKKKNPKDPFGGFGPSDSVKDNDTTFRFIEIIRFRFIEIISDDTSSFFVGEKDSLLKDSVKIKKLTFNVFKTIFSKNGKILRTEKITNYDSKVQFSSLKGFNKNDFNLTRSMGKDSINFFGLLERNQFGFNVSTKDKELFSLNKTLTSSNEDLNSTWTSEKFMEKNLVDPKQKKWGNLEKIAGLSLIGAGTAGSFYFKKIKVNIWNNHNGNTAQVFQKEFWSPQQIVSICAIPVGTYLLFDGWKRTHITITPASFTATIGLNPIK